MHQTLAKKTYGLLFFKILIVGTVKGLTLSGKWYYEEHKDEWVRHNLLLTTSSRSLRSADFYIFVQIASAGDYIEEPSGSGHTLIVAEDAQGTQCHSGCYFL